MPYKDPAAEKSRSARYYQEHREERLAYHAKYREEHREERLACRVQYYQSHREERRARCAQYYQEHREEQLAYHAQYREENREWNNAKRAKYYLEHHEEMLARSKEWRQANPLKKRQQHARRRALKKAVSIGPIDYAAIMVRDKMICGICHKKVALKDLHFDHIIPLSKGGAHAEYNIQVTHAFCNMSKRAGRLPSQTRLAL